MPSSFIKKEKKKRKIALDIVPPPLSELVAFRKRIAKTYGEAEAKAFDKRMDDVILREMIIEHNRNDQ